MPAQPRRVTDGVDSSGVAMLLAVLERRAGLRLPELDLYVSTVGGVKVSEPSADLAIALAIASAIKDQPISHDIVAFGEMSLAGKIRKVYQAAIRQNEAKRLGFTKVIDSGFTQLNKALAAGLKS